MANWLLSLQFEDGSFPSGHRADSDTKSVFNTGQILDGLLSVSAYGFEGPYMTAAEKAATWLADEMDDAGQWNTSIYDESCRTYYARACYPLALASNIPSFSRNEYYRAKAEKFVQWSLTKSRENHWIDLGSFKTREMAAPHEVLHTIAYAIEGLLESAVALNDKHTLERAILSATQLLRRFEIDRTLWGEYDSQWRKSANYVCVTGIAQMGRIWGRIFELTGDLRFLNALSKVNDRLRHVQPKTGSPIEIKGGFSGSIPIYGGYQPNYWPNWAAKFALDSMIVEKRIWDHLSLPQNGMEAV